MRKNVQSTKSNSEAPPLTPPVNHHWHEIRLYDFTQISHFAKYVQIHVILWCLYLHFNYTAKCLKIHK